MPRRYDAAIVREQKKEIALEAIEQRPVQELQRERPSFSHPHARAVEDTSDNDTARKITFRFQVGLLIPGCWPGALP